MNNHLNSSKQDDTKVPALGVNRENMKQEDQMEQVALTSPQQNHHSTSSIGALQVPSSVSGVADDGNGSQNTSEPDSDAPIIAQTEEEKKRYDRILANRRSARKSRERRRQLQDDLQRSVMFLAQENEQLKSENEILKGQVAALRRICSQRQHQQSADPRLPLPSTDFHPQLAQLSSNTAGLAALVSSNQLPTTDPTLSSNVAPSQSIQQSVLQSTSLPPTALQQPRQQSTSVAEAIRLRRLMELQAAETLMRRTDKGGNGGNNSQS